jgi:glutamate racemase
MKNYWLDKKKNNIPTCKDLQEATVDFQNNRTTKNAERLCEMFKVLVETILKYFGDKIDLGDRKQVTVECMATCFTKLRRYNPQKGKAFNFFTTIILSHMRQIYRTRRAYAELLARQNNRKK